MPDTPDPRWAAIYGTIKHQDGDPPDTRRVTLEIAAHGHKVGCAIVVAARDEPFLPQILDKMVDELDKAIHA